MPCLPRLRPDDVFLVWKLDRLSRSLKDLIAILEKTEKAGAKFQSLTEHIETVSPAGRMLVQMLGSFAEFERAMIRERTRRGLEYAKTQGRHGGRKPKLSPLNRRRLSNWWSPAGKSGAEAGRIFGVSKATVSRLVSRKSSIESLATLQKQAQKSGADKLSLEDIEQESQAVRRIKKT